MSKLVGHDIASGWIIAVRQRRRAVLQRVAVGLASGLAATPLVGAPLAAAWTLAYMAVQALEMWVFAPINTSRRADVSRERKVVGCLVLSLNTGLYGALSLPLWWHGGAMGGIAVAIMLPAAMIYSTLNAPRSPLVLACTVGPHVFYMALAPLFMMSFGASDAAVTMVSAAVVIFVVYSSTPGVAWPSARCRKAASVAPLSAASERSSRPCPASAPFWPPSATTCAPPSARS